mgnify:CR=1 FL=1
MEIILSNLYLCLFLTIVIEYGIVKLFYINKRVGIYVLLVNVMTNPMLVLIYNWILRSNNIMVLAFLEILAIIVEGYFYKRFFRNSYKEAYIVSTVANVIACLIGFLI